MSDAASPRFTNALAHETSPYLLQHAHNPVDWYPWGAEAIARQSGGRPIFLSIGYSACHWCHVMERESFENAEIAELLNEHFISIKVDREERPDLDDIYMHAVQAMTGHGGWPMSVFLTPDLVPSSAAPTSRRTDPTAWASKRASLSAYRLCLPHRNGQKVEQQAGALAAIRRSRPRRLGRSATPSPAARRRPLASSPPSTRTRGGFGGAPKFPPSMAI
jgi:uncharacterized protein